MITPEMKVAGWRERPTDAVRKAWEARDGRWQGVRPLRPPEILPRGWDAGDFPDILAWRPVHPSAWDYAAEGWGAVVPMEPG